MKSAELTVDGLVRDHAEQDDPVRCSRCYEPVYFVSGIVGPARWKHVATDSHVCKPMCKHCGQPAKHLVTSLGYEDIIRYWECDACAQKTFRIERT